jgi:uncharacterized protein DUF4844
LKTLIALAVVVGLLVAFILAGITGLLFRFWPTSIPDSQLLVTHQVIEDLRSLRAQPKYGPDPKRFYPGATSESTRKLAEEGVNLVIDHLIAGLPKRPQKAFVLATFKRFLPGFERFDSEEMDQTLYYLSEVMRIVGMQGSNELLNVWRYGFPYGWVLKSA